VKKVILFLEPVNALLKVVKYAHEQGFIPIAMHQYPLQTIPPYGEYVMFLECTKQIEDWSNMDEVMSVFDDLQARFNIVGTYTGAEVTLSCDAVIRERLGIAHTSREVISSILNKKKAREQLYANGLSKIQCFSCDEVAQWSSWPENKTLFLKPIHGAGSAGVHQLSSSDDFNKVQSILHQSRQTSFKIVNDFINSEECFIEEAAEGELISVEGFVSEGKLNVIGLTSRTVLHSNPVIEMGATFPYPHPLADDIFKYASDVIQCLGVQHNSIHMELMISDTNNIEFIELNMRFAGVDLITAMNIAYELEMESHLLDMAIGKSSSFHLPQYTHHASLQYILPDSTHKTFQSIDLPEEDLAFTRIFKNVDDPMPGEINQFGFVAGFIVADRSYEKTLEKAAQVRQTYKLNQQTSNEAKTQKVILR